MTPTATETSEGVMLYAAQGRLSKHALAGLLTAAARRAFLKDCAAIEMKYTNDCRAKNDPCLASGCSAEGERCLQPLLEAGTEYYKACGAEWVKLFADPGNRNQSWKVTFSHYDV
jgi:hypothetical protein